MPELGAIVAVEEARVDGKRPLRLLLEGRPGIGKTTVARRLLALLRDTGIPYGMALWPTRGQALWLRGNAFV